MSVFIWRKNKTAKQGNEYQVVRQTESLRNPVFGRVIEHGTFGRYDFKSDGAPAFSCDNTIYMRGAHKHLDDSKVWVGKEYVSQFERAIFLFNKEMSNNKDLTMSDVIWGPKDT
jgi:hypothetical protein